MPELIDTISQGTTPRPTLSSVARAAGVSRQTVSNVLNAPERVSPKTLAQVRAVLTSVGYRPNLAARQLRTGRSRILGMRVRPTTGGIDGAILDGILHALTDCAQEQGYRIVLFTAPTDAAEVGQYQELLDTTAVDGFVLTGTDQGNARARWLRSAGTPFVSFGRPWAVDTDPAASRDSWVDVNGAAGTELAVRHLVELGHRRIGFVGWPSGSGAGDERRAGWSRVMRALGADDAELRELDAQASDSVADGGRATEELLNRAEPTAVVCTSDSLGLGAIGVARQRRHPLAVVGYGDTPVAASIGLSSVAQPLSEVAAAVLRSLIRQIDDAAAPPAHDVLDPTLVVRASSASSGEAPK